MLYSVKLSLRFIILILANCSRCAFILCVFWSCHIWRLLWIYLCSRHGISECFLLSSVLFVSKSFVWFIEFGYSDSNVYLIIIYSTLDYFIFNTIILNGIFILNHKFFANNLLTAQTFFFIFCWFFTQLILISYNSKPN